MATHRLTFQQRQFVEFYLGDANGNATEAARLAGYSSPHQLGPRLVKKSSVRAAIDARLDESALTTNEILARLSDHATVTIDSFLRVSKDGTARIDLKKAKRRGRLHCVKKLKQGKYGVELELYDAQAALEKLGKYRGLFRESDAHAGAGSSLPPAAASAMLDAGLKATDNHGDDPEP